MTPATPDSLEIKAASCCGHRSEGGGLQGAKAAFASRADLSITRRRQIVDILSTSLADGAIEPTGEDKADLPNFTQVSSNNRAAPAINSRN